MFRKRYARWMYDWETRLTTRDENRVVRPLEWGFEWLEPFLEAHGFGAAIPGPESIRDHATAEAAMARINDLLIRHSDDFCRHAPDLSAGPAKGQGEGKLCAPPFPGLIGPECVGRMDTGAAGGEWRVARAVRGSRAAVELSCARRLRSFNFEADGAG